MEQCKTCMFYNKTYDDLRQSGIDIVGAYNEGLHFCSMYENGISKEITEDTVECPERVPNSEN